jgi:hypothetical protein
MLETTKLSLKSTHQRNELNFQNNGNMQGAEKMDKKQFLIK